MKAAQFQDGAKDCRVAGIPAYRAQRSSHAAIAPAAINRYRMQKIVMLPSPFGDDAGSCYDESTRRAHTPVTPLFMRIGGSSHQIVVDAETFQPAHRVGAPAIHEVFAARRYEVKCEASHLRAYRLI